MKMKDDKDDGSWKRKDDSNMREDLPIQKIYDDERYRRREFPMKWFQFIIYVQLFASALIGIIRGFGTLENDRFGSGITIFGRTLSDNPLDIVAGVLMIGLSGYAIFVRQRLAHFKKNAHKMYLFYLGANMATNVLYMFAAVIMMSMHSPGKYFYNMNFQSILTDIILFIANIVYFNKRKELFVE